MMQRRSWYALTLVGVGFFLHDAIWHALLVTVGMNGWVAMEFSLPDLGPLGIAPDRTIQALALMMAVLFVALLALAARRLRQDKQSSVVS